MSVTPEYRIAGKFGKDFNLANWQGILKNAKLKVINFEICTLNSMHSRIFVVTRDQNLRHWTASVSYVQLYCTADSAKNWEWLFISTSRKRQIVTALLLSREIEKADEKVKQALDASDRNSCSGKLTPRCKYNAYTAGIRQIKISPNFDLFRLLEQFAKFFARKIFPLYGTLNVQLETCTTR